MLLCTVCAGKATASSILYTSGYSVLIWGLIGGLGQVSQGPGVIKWELFNKDVTPVTVSICTPLPWENAR